MTTTRIKFILAYDGTDFAGWQHQGGVRTVQADVEAAIAKIVGERVPVQAAGRTDSGVHALGQCAHADIPEPLASRVPWRVALNSMLKRDVRVVEAGLAPPGFHAQFDATSKIYAYTLWHDRSYVNPLRRRFVWDVPQLDWAAMDEAAAVLVGRHDFNSFRNLGTPLGSRGTVRTLMGLWREPGPSPAETVWRARADGFLKQMVRNLVGCLVAVGKGKATPEDVRLILERRDRNHGLPTAPAQGLCMERVFYPGDDDGAVGAVGAAAGARSGPTGQGGAPQAAAAKGGRDHGPSGQSDCGQSDCGQGDCAQGGSGQGDPERSGPRREGCGPGGSGADSSGPGDSGQEDAGHEHHHRGRSLT